MVLLSLFIEQGNSPGIPDSKKCLWQEELRHAHAGKQSLMRPCPARRLAQQALKRRTPHALLYRIGQWRDGDESGTF